MGIEVVVDGLTKSFGSHVVWRDVSLSLPAGEVSVMLGPSGTGKTVFLKSLVGLVRPDRGRVLVDGIDTVSCSERQLYQVRKLFGVMFQDGALFGSLNLYDNVAFPLREHTKLTEAEIRRVVLEKMDMVGLGDAGHKFPGEISGSHISVEILAAAGAIVLGIDQDHVAGPTGQGVAQVVEGASHQPIAIGAMAAAWTGTAPVISALAADLGLGQVLDAGDARSRVGSIFAGSRHGETPGRNGPTRNYARRWRFVHSIRPVTLL